MKLMLPVIIACLCNTVGNLLWKNYFTKHAISFSNIMNMISILSSFQVIMGIFCYLCSMFLFFFLLSRYNLSLVIPLTSLTYIFNIITAVLFFKEKISSTQLVGTIIIFIGIFFVLRANQS